jgi:hypothetical protein
MRCAKWRLKQQSWYRNGGISVRVTPFKDTAIFLTLCIYPPVHPPTQPHTPASVSMDLVVCKPHAHTHFAKRSKSITSGWHDDLFIQFQSSEMDTTRRE